MPVTIKVYFTSTQQFDKRIPPFDDPVFRQISASANPFAAALDEYFKGPNAEEQGHGLMAMWNGFVGYRRIEFSGGTLNIYLTGNCRTNGTSYNIVQPLTETMRQFPGVTYVKIYDEYEHTRDPFGNNDSGPVCLDIIFTNTPTPTLTPTVTSTPTMTPTRTPRPTPTQTPTRTPTRTPLPTATPIPTNTATPTPLPTFTFTPSPTATNTRLPTATSTYTPLPTSTPQPTATPTYTPRPTATPTWTPLPTSTPRPMATSTRTPLPTATATPRPTHTPTWTPLPTSTPRPTATPTWTPLPTATATPKPTRTPTFTPGPTATPTWTPLPSATATPRPTATPTSTPLPPATATPRPTNTPTRPPLPTATQTWTPSPVPPTSTPTRTPLPTATWTPSNTPTRTLTPTVTPTLTSTPSQTPTFTPTATVTPSQTATSTPRPSATPTRTPLPTATMTPSRTPTWTPSPTVTPSPKPTWTPSPSLTPRPTNTPTPTSTPSRTPTPTPSSTPTITPTSTLSPTPTTYADCNRADFIGDVTISDNTILHLSEPFTKTWRIRNAGTCTWTMDYKLVFVRGEELGATGSAPMPYNVAPGQTVDISVDMTAPGTSGHYEGVWQLQSPDGRKFGVGSLGTDNIWVRIRVISPAYSTAVTPSATPTATMTANPPPTEGWTATPVPSATASVEVRYDFAGKACSAQWQSNTGVLTCPGKDGDPHGFVLSMDHAQLEDGTTASMPTILTFPQNAADGYILGVYPEYEVQPGDHLQTSVGCEKDATSCSVLFRVSYLDQDSNSHDLWALGEFYDGKYFNLDLDLSPLAGQKVKFVLYVGSLGSAAGDRALWVAPRIVHFLAPATSPTDTPTVTTPTNAATSSPAPTASVIPTSTSPGAPTATPVPASQPSPIQQVLDSIVSFFQRLFGR